MDTLAKDLDPVIQMLILMTIFSLLPFIFVCMTSFLRFVIVFSILKTALGTQQVPPGIVIIGLCLILTFYTMAPTFSSIQEFATKAYKETNSSVSAVIEGSKPLKEFMMKQTRESDLELFVSMTNDKPPATPDEITIWQVAPAYILSELRTSFEIGFVVFVPFIVLDLVVANVLLALGMFMLSPTIISLPFKLLIFIAVDGWGMIVNGLLNSFN